MGKINSKILILFLFIVKITHAQKELVGVVVNVNKEKIPFTIIEYKNKEDSQLSYLYSDEKGGFRIKDIRTNILEIKFSALGFSSNKVLIDIEKTDLNNVLIFVLKEKNVKLNEVVIRTKKPLILKKDTISIRTKHFSNGTEQTVEELLKKIPGLRVENDGTIKVGNKEIEKLMIEGDDFFEKGYKVLSKNMPAYPIEEVEVLKNYSNNRLLKGIEESDKVALNLKLNEKSKRIWFGNITSDYGLVVENLYNLKLNLMNFGKTNKYYFLTHLNNLGIDVTGDLKSLITPTSLGESSSIGDNEQVDNLMNLSFFNPFLNRERTNFNNEELISLNAIFNPSQDFKIKTLGFFNWDEIEFSRNKFEVVNTNNASFSNNESYRLLNKKKVFFGKVDLNYNISETKIINSTTKYNRGNFNDSSSLLFNSVFTNENLDGEQYLFDQKLNYSNKLKKNKVLLITGRYIKERKPQNYIINQFIFQDLFPNANSANNVSQEVINEMQFLGLNGHLLNRKENGDLWELQFGYEFRQDDLLTSLALFENENLLIFPETFQNMTSYKVNNLFFKNKYQFEFGNIDLIGRLDVHQLFGELENNNESKGQSPFFINPSFGVDWKIDNKNHITTSYSFSKKNTKIFDVFGAFALTSFRNFSRGRDGFDQLSSSNFFLNYQLGNWTDRFFVNTFINYNQNHDFISTNTDFNENFTLTEKRLVKNSDLLTVNSSINYFFKSISSNLKLNLGYNRNAFENSINGSDLREVVSSNYDLGLELRSSFDGIVNFHFGTKWNLTDIKTTTNLRSNEYISFFDTSFIFNNKFNIQLESEYYYFGNLEKDNKYFLLDFDVNYSLVKDKLKVGISGKNLLNVDKFRSFLVSDIGTSTTDYKLRGRFITFNVEFRF